MSTPYPLLRVRIPASGLNGEPLDWMACGAAGQVLTQGACVSTRLPAAEVLELVIPARLVAVHLLTLPAMSKRLEAAAINQQLEDRVLGGLADAHLVRGERQGDQLAVWLISRAWLQALLTACSSARLVPTHVVAEQALLPAQSYAPVADGVVYRTRRGVCGLLPDESLLTPVCGETLQRIDSLLGSNTPAQPDLLQGLPSLHRAARISRPLLITAAVLLGAVAIAWLLSLILTWRQLAAQEADVRERIRQSFAAAHPGVPLVDPILQWRQLHAGSARQGSDALDELAHLAEQLPASLQPRRIEADANSLRLTLTSSDAAILRPALQEKGIGFDTQTTDAGLEQFILQRKPAGAQP